MFQIPVFIGSNGPLVRPYSPKPFFGQNGFNGQKYSNFAKINLQAKPASIALVEMSKEVNFHLLCLAPLTNIALANKLDPGKLKC